MRSSTCASATSGTRGTCRARSTCRAATSSPGSSARVPDKSSKVLVYCAAGNRSAFAAKTLEELGYENVVSLAGGFTDWKRNGLPYEVPEALDAGEAPRATAATS